MTTNQYKLECKGYASITLGLPRNPNKGGHVFQCIMVFSGFRVTKSSTFDVLGGLAAF